MQFNPEEYEDKNRNDLIGTIRVLYRALDDATKYRYKLIRESAQIYNELKDIKGPKAIEKITPCLN